MNQTIAMPTPTGKPARSRRTSRRTRCGSRRADQQELHGARDRAREGRKVSATFVPGNLNELLMLRLRAQPAETNALQNGMRKKSGKMIMDAERDGQSEDVCTYVKADLGMMMGGEIGPTGDPMPRPDVLLLSYTGCFTFMKWFG